MATMVPTLKPFMDAHRLTDITVVAEAGMLSENNKNEIEAPGLGFILGGRIRVVGQMRPARDARQPWWGPTQI